MKSSDNQVKERPVNWTSDEVVAALAGRKTQMRVPIAKTPETAILFGNHDWRYDGKEFTNDGCCNTDPRGAHMMERVSRVDYLPMEEYESIGYCPLGKVGDLLWVRETHRPMGWSYDDNTVNIQYKDGAKQTRDCYPEYLYPLDYEDLSNNYLFKICDELEAKSCPKASDGDENWQYDEVFDGDAVERLMSWRSPIAMPRWASRLTIEITDVRVERLQHIGDKDAKAEGFDFDGPPSIDSRSKECGFKSASTHSFADNWNKNKAKRGYEWASNPWVWVIEFKTVEGA